MVFIGLIALFGWIPCVIVLFVLMPVHKAAATAIIGAWLLLPPLRMEIAGLPDYSKATAAVVGIVLSTFLFGSHLLVKFRPRWFDLPMLLWCLTVIVSSLLNGLGLYNGLSDALGQFVGWGLPYLLGRLYFNNLENLRTFAIVLIVGGLSYVLPCLWEIRMSPHLLRTVYGIEVWSGSRMGGYRPNVFFKTGLELGLFMTAASLTGWWLWRCGTIKRIGRVSFGSVLLPILMGTTVLCRSTGALLLLVIGMFVLWASTRFQTRKVLWALVLFFPVYAGLRIPNIWSGKELVELAKMTVGADRAESLEYRFRCEYFLVAKAMQQPIWGWSGWGRSNVYWEGGIQDEAHSFPADGLWISTLGTKGLVGLILLYMVLELPVMLFLVRFPVRHWCRPEVAPVAVIATLLALDMVDCTLNGFINVIYVTLIGGLIGVTPTKIRTSSTGLYATKGAVNDAGSLQQNVIAAGPGSRVIGAGQSSHLSSPVASRIALVDRYRELGRSLESQGRWRDTHSAWQQAFDILTDLTRRHPDIPDLQSYWCDCGNDLAWLLLKHPESDSRGLAHALTLAMQVVDRCSEGEAYWNTLGVAYLRNGEPRAAIDALDRALGLAVDDNPFNHVFLAIAHAQLGEREQARHWLAQAVLRKEQCYQNHHELTCFCDEARAVIGADPEAASVVI